MSPIERCGAHDGVCENITRIERRIERDEERHDNCEKTVVKAKLFYILISVLIVLFAALFGLQLKTNEAIGQVKQTLGVQAVDLKYIVRDIEKIKKGLP